MIAPPLDPVFIGIDPGFAGAVGVITVKGKFVACWDMPTSTLMGEGRHKEFDVEALADIVATLACWKVRAVHLEWVQTRPDEAPEASKRFGVGLGLLEGMLTYVGLRPERVAPNKWKGRLGLIGKSEGHEVESRNQSVYTAERFIPTVPAGLLRGPRGGAKDGRAEALLIAWAALTATIEGLRHQPEDVRLARVVFGSRRRKRRGIL